MLLRLTNLRGVDLNLFDFDFDMTWAGFFLASDALLYGRYGSRDATSAESHNTLEGLNYALKAALDRHRTRPRVEIAGPPRPPRTAEQYPAAANRGETSCIHCHHVHEFRRDLLQSLGQWTLNAEWLYPPPENLGLKLDLLQGQRVNNVTPDSPASRANIRAGDELIEVDGVPVASVADVFHALNQVKSGNVTFTTRTGDAIVHRRVDLPANWRRSDISWRWSLRSLGPQPPVHGDDLTADEKHTLGLAPDRLAFRQGPFVSRHAEQAGVRQNDVIVGINGEALKMNHRQFAAFIRLTYKVGDPVTLNLLRKGQRLNATLKLTRRGE